MAVVAVPLEAVQSEWDPLFAAGPGVQSTRMWFEATIEAALPAGARAEFLLCRDAGRPVAMLPLLVGPGDAARGLSIVYTSLFQPLLAPGLLEADVRRAGFALARHCRRWPTLVLDALDPEWPGLPPLLRGFQDGGMWPRPFDHFGNWHAPVMGLGWAGYLAGRPGRLRETIRRKTRAAARDRQMRFEIIRGPDRMAQGIAAYEDVYRRSWKAAEPSPGFTPALLPRLAGAGVLRLGLLWAGGTPVAAQYWTVADGTATVLKLAHDDAWQALSPGTLLTAHMIEHVLGEGVASLDFGRGDDPYKASWASERRARTGVLLANPRRLAGLVALSQHAAGALWRRRHTRRFLGRV